MLKFNKIVTFGVFIILVVDVQNVTLGNLENSEEKNKKCLKVEENAHKLGEVCLSGEEGESFLVSSLKNGAMEKDADVCLMSTDEDRQTNGERSDPSSEVSESDSSYKFVEELKKNLNWIRWTEYSHYAKDLINSNKWESVQDDLITVVSYNVLSQVLLERHRYLYKKNDETCLSWDFRSRILLQELEDFNADILCLQEVDFSLVNSFYNYNLEKMGYHGIYKQRTNDKVDGCAIYFKKDKFSLVSQMTVELFKESVYLLNRDNIGIILKLKKKSNPESEFIIATTHLLYNPKRGDIKLAQTQLMLAEIEKMAYVKHSALTQQPEYLPIIFTGDMNYPPENGVYQLVTKSFLEYEGVSSEQLVPTFHGHMLKKTLLPPIMGVTDSCQFASTVSKREGSNEVNFSTGSLGHHLNLDSVYDHIKGNLPEATTNQNRWVTVDYIFYSQIWNDSMNVRTEGNLKLVSRLTLPNSLEAEVFLKYLPNKACASDHLPLLATFHLSETR